jgi:hypothetical protein
VDYAVYGPSTAGAPACTGTALTTAQATIGSNTTRSLPQWTPARTGYYAWQVAARGNSTTRPASTCGTAFLTQKNTITKQSRVGLTYTVKVGHEFGLDVIVSGFDRPEAHLVRTRVYGPFLHKDKARCTSSRLFRTLLTSIANNNRWKQTTVVDRGGDIGFYVFQTTLDAGTFMRSSHSRCGIAIHVTR